MPGLAAECRDHLVAEVHRVGVPERRGEQEDEDAGQLGGRGLGRQRRPTGGPRQTSQHVQLGARAQSDPVQDGQPDRDTDALLHPDEDHGEQRHRGQPELEEVEAGDGAQIGRLEEPDRDVDQDGGQRRERHVLEDIGDGDEQDDRRGPPRALRPGCGRRRWRRPRCGAGWRRPGTSPRGPRARCPRRRRRSHARRRRRSRPDRRRRAWSPPSGSRRPARPRPPAAPGSRASTTTTRSARGAGRRSGRCRGRRRRAPAAPAPPRAPSSRPGRSGRRESDDRGGHWRT